MNNQNKIEKLISEFCPKGVEFKTLGELGIFYGGLSGKSKEDFSNGNAKYVTYMNIASNIAVNTDINTFVKVGEDEHQNKVEYGDSLFTGSSETPDEVGISSVMTKKIDEPLYLNSFCFGFRLHDKNIFLPEFLKYLFRDDDARKQIIKTASGVTRFNVSKKRFAKIKIPIPPLAVQEEIVKILNSFTELEAELEARKKQHEYYRYELLTFDKNVRQQTLNEVASFVNGKGHERYIDDDGKYIVVNSKFVSTGGKVKKYSVNQISPVFKNDILMVMSDLPNGKALAKCFFVDENNKYTLNQRICALSIKNKDILDAKYLHYILNRNKQLLRYDNGVDQTNLRKEDILKIQIPIPATKEQKRIVSVLDKFVALVNDISIGLPAELKARRQQYEYYRNKLLTFKEYAN